MLVPPTVKPEPRISQGWHLQDNARQEPFAASPALLSYKLAWDWVLQQGPQVQWVRQARWVDDGDVITSSGVSAGIDMALSLIARMYGREMALTSARNMEYIWNEDATNDPFA
jgi:hypothetical protein